MSASPRLDPRLLAELARWGVPWRAERRRRHVVLYVGERRALTMPSGRDESFGRTAANALAAVRRAARAIAEESAGCATTSESAE